MKRIFLTFLILLLPLCSLSDAQFGDGPYSHNPFSSTGAFGFGPFGVTTSSAGACGGTPNAMTFNGNCMTFNGAYMTFSGTP